MIVSIVIKLLWFGHILKMPHISIVQMIDIKVRI